MPLPPLIVLSSGLFAFVSFEMNGRRKMENYFYALLMVLFFAALFHAGWKACQDADRTGLKQTVPKEQEDPEPTFGSFRCDSAGVFAVATVYTGGCKSGEDKKIPEKFRINL